MSDSLRPHELQPTKLFCPWDSPGKSGVGCHALFQGIFPNQRSNPGILFEKDNFQINVFSGLYESGAEGGKNKNIKSEL